MTSGGRGRNRLPSSTVRAGFVAGHCVNCDGTTVTVASPLYCSPGCRQAAELVRYVRSATADGRITQADVREAIQMRLAMVLGGGYPESERRVAAALRWAVFERAEGKCEECGRVLDFDGSSGDPDAVATIQHKAGNSNDMEDLAAFCRRCNTADAQAKFVPVQPGSPEALLAQELRVRWSAPSPLRVCDDHETWGSLWRGYTKESKDLLRARETAG
ncbi:MAG: hypothetical protein M0Z46_17075 [Actinomycetota bacterium]|nr:hypothetical protein [Actinomycetota bacterium]